MNETTQLYQQLPGESDKAFHAFQCYLALGAKRSLATLAKQIGSHKTQVERWSKRWQWVSRLRVHRQRIAQIQDVATAEAIHDATGHWVRRGEQLKDLEWNITLRLLDRAGEILQTPDSAPSTRNACLAVELASKIGRLASDVASVNTDPATVRNGIPAVFAAALQKVYGPSTPPSNPANPPSTPSPAIDASPFLNH